MAIADTLRGPGPSTSPPASKDTVDERRVMAWIGQGVIVEGKIMSAQDLRIDGQVEGTIEVGNHGLILGAGAAVKANLTARTILISGAVIGNVTATERVDLQATGSVEGDISAPRLVMVDGAVVKGKVATRGNRGAAGRDG
jgi:cytoskeletal protein CcmA (bactofilin family)